MKIYKLHGHKYFTSFGAVFHLKTLKKINGVKLEKAEIIEATDNENKKIYNYLMEMDKEEEKDTVYSPHYYDMNGDLWVR